VRRHQDPIRGAHGSTRPSCLRGRMAPTAAALAAVLAGLALPAQAIQIETGNSELGIRFDNTVRYNFGLRSQGQDAGLLGNPNVDDGNRNFSNGAVVANRLDLLSEFDLSYRKSMGLRVSAAAWYDDAYRRKSKDNTSLATTNNLVGGVQTLGYNDYVKRFYKGASGELLDAFAFYRGEIANSPLSLKVGRSVEYWGEALLGNTHAISYSQMPLDTAKALAIPGIEIKEVFRPIGNLTARLSPADNVTVAAQYFFDWEPTRLPEPGTYLGAGDSIANSGNVLLLGPAKVLRLPDVTPKKSGEYGLSVRWASKQLDSTIGFYYRNFADKLGQIHLANFAGPLPRNYFYAFADKIDLYGMSVSKQIGIASVGAELSYRRNMPLISDTVPVLSAASMPGQGQTGGARGNTWHGVLNMVAVLPGTGLWDTLALTGELNWNRWDKVTQGIQYFKGRGAAPAGSPVPYAAYTALDAVSKDFVGIALGATPTWLQVMPGVDLSMPFSVSDGISGNSAVVSGGNKNAGSWSLGLSADIDQRHSLALRYAGYFGQYTTAANGAMSVANGLTAILRDRGFVSLTFKTTF